MIHSSLLSRIPGLFHGFGTLQDSRPADVITVRQVHGVRIFEPEAAPPPGDLSEPEGYDTVLTDRPGLLVAVKTADCLPILLAEPEAGIVAAVHAGWKGTLARVAQAAIGRIREKGGSPENIVCALGPNMVGGCFEVEADVAEGFEREFPGWPLLTRVSPKKWLLDVAKANLLQLRESGVREDLTDRVALCTHCRPDLFWSFRRDGKSAGRMVNVIGLSGGLSGGHTE